MQLAELRGGYLFQSRPDLFPFGRLTPEEIALWGAYYEYKEAGERGRR